MAGFCEYFMAGDNRHESKTVFLFLELELIISMMHCRSYRERLRGNSSIPERALAMVFPNRIPAGQHQQRRAANTSIVYGGNNAAARMPSSKYLSIGYSITRTTSRNPKDLDTVLH